MLLKMQSVKRLLIIDGNNAVCRAFFAIKSLTDPQGRLINAVYGFCKMMMYLLETYSPSHIAIFFDSYSKRRKELYSEYKMNRKKEGLEDLYNQMLIAKELVVKLGMKYVRMEGYEADDLITIIADKAHKENLETYIYTTDKDLCQLVTKDNIIKVLRPGFKGETLLDYEGVYKKFGVTPDNIALYLGLVGDTSDNIPGVRGIGDKTASKIINQYLIQQDGHFVFTKNIPDKLKLKLVENKDMLKLSLELAVLKPYEELQLPEISAFKFDHFGEEAIDYLRSLGFKSIIDKL
jgi:DNA polymerase-1